MMSGRLSAADTTPIEPRLSIVRSACLRHVVGPRSRAGGGRGAAPTDMHNNMYNYMYMDMYMCMFM